ncbi:MAG: hypothetical protein ACOCT7_02455 [Candidatus Saliniplasma sp.]
MTEKKCPLCGNRFEESEATACSGCILGGNCNLVKCTNCGYEFMPGVDDR